MQPPPHGFVAGTVVVDGHPGHLHQPRLDGIHQPEVGGHPLKLLGLGLAGGVDPQRGGREVQHRMGLAASGLGAAQRAHVAQRPDGVEPHRSPLVFVFVGLRSFLFWGQIAVVGLVVDHAQAIAASPGDQVAQHPAHCCLPGFGVVAPCLAQKLEGRAVAYQIALGESLEVHHPHFGPVQGRAHVLRHDAHVVVYVVGV